MKATLALLLFFYSIFVHAATINPKVAKHDTCGRYELFHVNGIMTDSIGAAANLRRIEEVYGNSYKEHLIAYRLAYNQTRGFKTDFLDSAKQVIAGYAGATWDAWMKAVTFGVYSLGMSSTTSATIAKKVTDLFGFTKPSPYQDQDLWDITNKIVSQTAGGGRRLLFCHSQGNLYCNLVYDQLIARGVAAKTIGLVGLAVPYSSLKTGNVYTTSVNDVVIDAVRKATLSTILSTTLTIPYAPTIDALGHNLIRTYFANSGARDQITTNITNEFGTLKSEYPAIQWPGVTYANTLYSWCQGCVYWNGVAWVLAQPTYKWINLGPFPQSYITVWPGTLASAMSQASVNGQACYGFAVAEIKAQRLLGNTGFVSMFPKYYGCWEVAGNDPATSFNPSAWWLYGGDLPPAWRVIHDVQSGKVRAEGGARCTI